MKKVSNSELNQILSTFLVKITNNREKTEELVTEIRESTDSFLKELSNTFANIGKDHTMEIILKDGREQDGVVEKIVTVDIHCNIDGNTDTFSFSL